MAKITLEMIKELREKTQVGMMDCKKALISADGDLERAIEVLRKKGASVAAKRSGHATNNGRIETHLSEDKKIGALVEIACETDFSANTPDMQAFAKTLAEHVAHVSQCCPTACDPACLNEQKLFSDENKTIKTLLDELIAKISENIKISRCARFNTGENGIVNVYIHPGSTLATMVELEVKGLSDSNKELVLQLAKDLCMQIAVTNPIAYTPEQLDPELVEKEKCVAQEQLKGSSKPEQIIEKIIQNKVNKLYEEVCLLNQRYIKENKLSVAEYIKSIEKEGNCTIKIKQSERFIIGG